MTQVMDEEPDAAVREHIRRAKRCAFIKGMSFMAAAAIPLMAGSYALGLLGSRIVHWALP